MAVTYNIKGTSNPSFKIGKNGVILSPENNTSETTITLPDATGTVVLQDTTDTLSNKTLASPTFSGTASGSLAIANTTVGDSLLITTTEDSSTAGPVIALKRNSASPADADYIGQLKFKGENDNDQEITYAKITGKILDASDGSEDGMIEYAFIKGGSQNISARFRGDALQLLNGTNLYVGTGGNIQFEGATADAHEITLAPADATADRTITMPDATGTIVLQDSTDTLTNKTIGAATIAGHLIPDTNEAYDLGSSTNRFNDIYLAGDTVDIGGTKLSKDSSGDIDIKDSGGNRKIIKAAAIELFDSSGKKMRIERDASSGKMKSRRFGADGNAEADTDDVVEIAEDKSPQLGGTLETNGHLLRFGDSASATDDRLQFGASQDLEIYHDGSHSYVKDAGTGQLRLLTSKLKIRNEANNEDMAVFTEDGAVELYHNNAKKVETTTTGIQTTGTLNVNGVYNLPTSDGSANQFLKTDGAGTVSFATVPQTVVEDTTPQLGGDLDVNGNKIVSTSNGDVEIEPNGTGNTKITSTGALILPVGTTAQRPATPVVGMFRFNSTTDRFEGYNGASWVILGSVLPTNEATDYGATTETAISNHDYGAITDADSIIIDYKTIT
tara:strand:+ start:422 stop:2266 length:1845 start_codon:yes stop_codon:yes gene_type:complete